MLTLHPIPCAPLTAWHTMIGRWDEAPEHCGQAGRQLCANAQAASGRQCHSGRQCRPQCVGAPCSRTVEACMHHDRNNAVAIAGSSWVAGGAVRCHSPHVRRPEGWKCTQRRLKQAAGSMHAGRKEGGDDDGMALTLQRRRGRLALALRGWRSCSTAQHSAAQLSAMRRYTLTCSCAAQHSTAREAAQHITVQSLHGHAR